MTQAEFDAEVERRLQGVSATTLHWEAYFNWGGAHPHAVTICGIQNQLRAELEGRGETITEAPSAEPESSAGEVG